jgi:hypothetical protein
MASAPLRARIGSLAALLSGRAGGSPPGAAPALWRRPFFSGVTVRRDAGKGVAARSSIRRSAELAGGVGIRPRQVAWSGLAAGRIMEGPGRRSMSLLMGEYGPRRSAGNSAGAQQTRAYHHDRRPPTSLASTARTVVAVIAGTTQLARDWTPLHAHIWVC